VIDAAVRWAPLRALVATLGALAFVTVGFVGVYRYLDGYWVYRGFPPPSDPAYVSTLGTEQTIEVASPAVGRKQQVDVYLPPGYSTHAHRRYPVLYLLHGEPGRPAAFLETVRMGVVEDELVALRRAHSYFWLYTGRDDRFRSENVAFARLLARDRIPHRLLVVDGGHNWALWRGNAASSYLVASAHLRHAP